MRKTRFVSLLCAVLLLAALLPTATADALPQSGDFVLRIEGGNIDDHTETVNGQRCLRVELFLDGVTSDRLLSSMTFDLAYDPALLSYASCTVLNGGMYVANPEQPGLFRFVFISANGAQLDGNTPFLTLYFTVADGLADGTQILFSFVGPIRADSVRVGNYSAQNRTVGAVLKPFYKAVFYGDVNCDGKVSASDAALILRALIGLSELSVQGERNAHVSGSADLCAKDAASILRWVVGLIARFPAES